MQHRTATPRATAPPPSLSCAEVCEQWTPALNRSRAKHSNQDPGHDPSQDQSQDPSQDPCQDRTLTYIPFLIKIDPCSHLKKQGDNNHCASEPYEQLAFARVCVRACVLQQPPIAHHPTM